jgi:hypothetical protein
VDDLFWAAGFSDGCCAIAGVFVTTAAASSPITPSKVLPPNVIA